jgi:hypothetical protein
MFINIHHCSRKKEEKKKKKRRKEKGLLATKTAISADS